MAHILRRLAFAGLSLALAVAAIAVSASATSQDPMSPDAQVDKLLARWTMTTPGCAVAASERGKTLVSKAAGMADLEHDVRNTPETIFEAGSVSKQFTAAAMLLLAKEGKLALNDPVRKYIPELPDYGAPLLIRHMLNHTSGLRDWGSVEAIAGWPRTSRAYTHDHVLDIVSRQKALNFPSGTRYSYSNTGYNLSAVIVSRVSGMSFAEFSRTRLFAPLGMTSTSWRDDFTRIVKGRAIAYSAAGGGYRTNMPFENVHGNGGLLTTVGDLLKWNDNFVTPVVGDAAFVAEQQTPGKYNDGRQHAYALGLMVGKYRGVDEVSHSGATAGYTAFLTRLPTLGLSVAVLCNSSNGGPGQVAHAVADIYAGTRLQPATPPAAPVASKMDVSLFAGLYRDRDTGVAMTVSSGPQGLRAGSATLIFANAEYPESVIGEFTPGTQPAHRVRFKTTSGQTWLFAPQAGLFGPQSRLFGPVARITVTDVDGTIDQFEGVKPATPTAAKLDALAATYVSDEAETTFIAVREGDGLVLKRRPAATIRLTPTYDDGFTAPGLGTVVFRRDKAGKVVAFSVSQDRVWDLRFSRR